MKLINNILVIIIIMDVFSGCTLQFANKMTESTQEQTYDYLNVVVNQGEVVTETEPITDGLVTNKENNTLTTLNLENIPEYSGNPTIIINDNKPYFTIEDKTRALSESWELYSNLDEFGRCGVAYANVGKELMPTEERGKIGQIKPSGWHTYNFNGIVEIDGNYLYNRCHLIAFCLAGENANEKNLITGTRYMNVDGMLPYETLTADYLDHNPYNHVLYRVTPIYTNNNLVANGVLIEAYSVEDNGAGICFCVYCYNVQPGVIINYSDGTAQATK